MTDSIKKCSDCRFAVPALEVGDKEWAYAKCYHRRSLTEDDGAKWHLGLTGEVFAYCSGMRQSRCGKAAKFFEPRGAPEGEEGAS